MKTSVRIIASLLLFTAFFAARAEAILSTPFAAAGVLHWKAARIQVAVSSSLTRESSAIKNGSDIGGAVQRSLEAWQKVANIEFVEATSDRQNVSPAGVSGDGVSLITIAPSAENVLLFARESDQVAATTRVFYNGRGLITEADIVLNPYQQFSTDGTLGTFDLESTLTHEIGHLLGLEHSSVLGSTMHESYGKNGVYGIQNFASRTLSASDIAAVRAIYGPRGNTECCGQVTGRLVLATGKFAKNADVWLENYDTGRVEAKSISSADGTFRFDGLTFGTYKVFSQENRPAKRGFPAQEVGEVEVAKGETSAVTKRISPSPPDFELSYFGFNGQLSDVVVALNAGRTYTVYIGGKNLDPKTTAVGFNSPYLSVIPNSLRSLEYDRVSVISFEVRVDPRTPKGDYSVYAENRDGRRSILIGALTVDSFENPYSTFVLAEE